MSAGSFVESTYASGDGSQIHRCRIQPETLGLTIGGTANTAPAGAVNNAKGVRMTGGRSRLTIGARGVGIRFETEGDAGYEVGSTTYVPWLNPATFYGVLEPQNQTGTYNGATVTVIGNRPERL